VAAGCLLWIAEPSAQFSARVSHVEVYATVTDSGGAPVSGLAQNDFAIEEDGQPQTIALFAAGGFPLAVALAVDRSFSLTAEQLERAVTGARTLLSLLQPGDRAMVVAVGSEVEVVAPLSDAHGRAVAALAQLDRWGTTPLYDAALAGIDAIQSATGRRALVLLSDGVDRGSRTHESDVIDHARASDVLIYPVALGRARPAVFAELAAATGGRSAHAPDGRALDHAVRSIAEELRFQYLLGYQPLRPETDRREWRSVRVTVNRPGVRVRARDGYFTRRSP
jgi:Ca-activated chloride channel family protein